MSTLNLPLEKVELINYNPTLKTSGDLESANRTITATSEAAGLGNADYSTTLNLPKPGDARLAVMRIGTRLSVTVDSKTATHLYCRVYVDVQDDDHRLFDLDITSTGNFLAIQDCYSGIKTAIFNLITDGASHTFYFFFWVDAGNAVLSVVQLWEAVGTNAVLYTFNALLELTHTGWLAFSWMPSREGTGASGSLISRLNWKNVSHNYPIVSMSGVNATPTSPFNTISYDSVELKICGAEATDLKYIIGACFVLRSER
jgi:hypothetical protein